MNDTRSKANLENFKLTPGESQGICIHYLLSTCEDLKISNIKSRKK